MDNTTLTHDQIKKDNDIMKAVNMENFWRMVAIDNRFTVSHDDFFGVYIKFNGRYILNQKKEYFELSDSLKRAVDLGSSLFLCSDDTPLLRFLLLEHHCI